MICKQVHCLWHLTHHSRKGRAQGSTAMKWMQDPILKTIYFSIQPGLPSSCDCGLKGWFSLHENYLETKTRALHTTSVKLFDLASRNLHDDGYSTV